MNYSIFTVSTLTAKYAVKLAQSALYLSILSLIYTGHLLITMTENAIIFKDALIEGHQGLDGSFCSLYCDISDNVSSQPSEVLEPVEAIIEKTDDEIVGEINEMFGFHTYSFDELQIIASNSYKIKGVKRIKKQETLIKKICLAIYQESATA